MRKQYLPQVQFKKDEGTNKWMNAMAYSTEYKRYCSTLEEAESALNYAKSQFNRGAREERIDAGGLGMTFVVDDETADRMQIVKTRIKVREVTEWKEV